MSGHLARVWPDVMNSTWVYPENRWHETYSDRGGNLPYWLNGVIPMVFQTRALSDSVDSSGYNLTEAVIGYMRRLVQVQAKSGYPMHDNFNLGTWNVVRSCLLLTSAVPSESAGMLPFVMDYIAAAHARLKAKGWGTDTVCTECDQAHPQCAEIPGGGVCRFRFPEWMHILQAMRARARDGEEPLTVWMRRLEGRLESPEE